MKFLLRLTVIVFLFVSCGSSSVFKSKKTPDFIIAFGSCNDQEKPQPLWDLILQNHPDLFIWGGDNIYSDTDDPSEMKKDYEIQKNNSGYKKLVEKVPVLGTWDDHDYGLNDGGSDWHFKDKSQEIFLDFFAVPDNSPRRNREGVYHSEILKVPEGSIKILLLDTRYFRSPLKRDNDPDKKYQPSQGTILGEEQWAWLKKELASSEADFNIIMSSIQVLSGEHGYESWGNFTSEVEKLKDLIVNTGPKNVILLSGDRHISEFSVANIVGLNYKLMDFTSSGLTHAYEDFEGEPNKYREGEVVKEKSFGLLKFDFDKEKVILEMRGLDNKLQQDYVLEFQ